jgi:hypothetical protein
MFFITSTFIGKQKLLAHFGILERYLLLDEHLTERFRWTTRKDGCVREQNRNIQAGRNDSWDCVGAMVYVGSVLLRTREYLRAYVEMRQAWYIRIVGEDTVLKRLRTAA